jgi:N-acetylglutamate synthase-like GNAT family acetyltransferase
MDAIFLMGRDAWGKGKTVQAYLVSCRHSPKYKRGQWYALEDAERGLVSSLIVYRLSSGVAGIGSIATARKSRGNGLASRLIGDILKRLDRRGTRRVFLFADISPRFYERFGFAALPPEYQKHPGSVCMLRERSAGGRLKAVWPPDYF